MFPNFGDFRRPGTFLPRGIQIVGAWLSNLPISRSPCNKHSGNINRLHNQHVISCVYAVKYRPLCMISGKISGNSYWARQASSIGCLSGETCPASIIMLLWALFRDRGEMSWATWCLLAMHVVMIDPCKVLCSFTHEYIIDPNPKCVINIWLPCS